MAYEFKFPDVGEGITEGTLVNWDVEKGSEVKVDQSVAHVETDKAVVEIPSPISGIVKELRGEKGDTLNVGDVFMIIETEGEESSNSQDEESSTASQSESVEKENSSQNVPTSEKKVNEEKSDENVSQENISEKTVSLTSTTSSQILAMPAVSHEAKKRGIDLSSITPSGNHGQILLSDLDKGSSSKSVSQEIPSKSTSEEKSQSIKTPQVQESSQEPLTKVREDIVASLSVKKLARELGVDINFVVGTGEYGRITQDDVQRAKEMRDKHVENTTQSTSSDESTVSSQVVEQTTTSSTQQNPQETPQDETANTSQKTTIELKGVRGAIAKKMKESLSQAAQVTMCDEVEISDLVALREKEKEKLKEQGVRLSYLPFIIKAVKHACKLYPEFNGNFNDETQTFEISDELHMGIAVDTPKGLIVPVIQNAHYKSIVELANSIVELAKGAQESSLSLQQMQGSTFTISSVGSLGATQAFTPILNYPNSAILGVGRIVDKPVCRDGEIVAGKTITLSLTVDHRVIDGAQAARFLKDIMDLLQDPELLLMEI